MANLVSTAPVAYNALYGLLQPAAQAQQVDLFVGELEQYEPGTYVLLGGVENHTFEIRTLDYASFLEEYDITGVVSVVTGDIDPTGIITAAYAIYQSVVQATVVSNAGMAGNGVLGVPSGQGGPLDIIPGYARYSATPGNFGGGQGGFQGTIAWSYHLRGYLTRA